MLYIVLFRYSAEKTLVEKNLAAKMVLQKAKLPIAKSLSIFCLELQKAKLPIAKSLSFFFECVCATKGEVPRCEVTVNNAAKGEFAHRKVTVHFFSEAVLFSSLS